MKAPVRPETNFFRCNTGALLYFIEGRCIELVSQARPKVGLACETSIEWGGFGTLFVRLSRRLVLRLLLNNLYFVHNGSNNQSVLQAYTPSTRPVIARLL